MLPLGCTVFNGGPDAGGARPNLGKMIPDLPWQKRSDWIDVKTDVTPAAKGDGITDDTAALQKALETGSILGAAYEDTRSQGQAVFDLALALAKGSDPGKAGWRIADAKYVWIPYKIYLKNPDSPLP